MKSVKPKTSLDGLNVFGLYVAHETSKEQRLTSGSKLRTICSFYLQLLDVVIIFVICFSSYRIMFI